MGAMQQATLMGGGGGGGSSWTPASLFAASEKGYWLDFNDLSTMFQDTAGTTPVTATGQTVKRINDKSGNGHAFTSSVGAVLTLDATTGYNYLLFNGTSIAFTSTATINLSTTDKLAVCVGTLSDALVTSPSYIVETGTNYTSPGGGYGIIQSVVNSNEIGFAASGSAAAFYRGTALTDGSRLVLFCNYDIAGAAIAQEIMPRADGAVPSLTVGNAGPMGTGNFGNITTYIGARTGSSGWWKGRLYGVVVRGASTTGADLTSLETYMNTRTGAF